ncbi:MAG: DUF1918 domain-containing protein [Actinophytocola sp.]|nr:DUF1918 domain-containing protein [Actinophytocola sp.]
MVHAERGDWLIIERAAIGQPPRRGLIVGVRSVDGSPLYRVRWGGNGHVSLISPGPDARVVKAADARLGRTGRSIRNSPRRRWWRWRRRQ